MDPRRIIIDQLTAMMDASPADLSWHLLREIRDSIEAGTFESSGGPADPVRAIFPDLTEADRAYLVAALEAGAVAGNPGKHPAIAERSGFASIKTARLRSLDLITTDKGHSGGTALSGAGQAGALYLAGNDADGRIRTGNPSKGTGS